MKKTVLFVYPQMMMGGSTTSLLSVLNNLNYSEYDVDLLLLYEGGPLFDRVPHKVNILPFGHRFQNKCERKLRRLLSPKYFFTYLCSRFVFIKTHNEINAQQYIGSKDVDLFRKVDKNYDVAIGFLEGPADRLVANRIKAKKKIGWFHLDYIECGYIPKYDKGYFGKLDNIVLVSSECKKSFDDVFPEYVDKTIVIENILSNNYIRNLSQENASEKIIIEKQKVNFVSTCRIDFSHKGLDRVIEIINNDKENKLWDKFKWYIIGDGPDKERLQQLIEVSSLRNRIILLGNKINPFPYMKDMDMFFLPSRFEGKPMAVTEAMILGIPALVTNYSSAYEQINNDVDGIIVDNNNDGILLGLQKILSNKSIINKLRENVKSKDYSNVSEMEKIYMLFEKEND